MRILHFGTFDVENYGDLLFPLLVRRRLAHLDAEVIHVSPTDHPGVWSDGVPAQSFQGIVDREEPVDAVLIGGGNIVHVSASGVEAYNSPNNPQLALMAYADLWIGATWWGVKHRAPVLWNAPGVPGDLDPAAAPLVAWALIQAGVVTVRDPGSREVLRQLAPGASIDVVPDIALEVNQLWTPEEREQARREAFETHGHTVPPSRYVVYHLNRRYLGEPVPEVAQRLERIAGALDATPVVVAFGRCHNDQVLLEEICDAMSVPAIRVVQPGSLREVAALIEGAMAYVGSSLHGCITACAFGVRTLSVASRRMHKFQGFLQPFGLQEWQTENWKEAEGLLEHWLKAPSELWESVAVQARPILDAHWSRLLQGLSRPTSADGISTLEPIVQKLLGDQPVHQGIWPSAAQAQHRRVVALQRRVATMEHSIRERSTRVAALKDQVEARDAALKSLVSATSDLNRNLKELQGQVENRDAELQRLNQCVDDQKFKITQFEQLKEEIKARDSAEDALKKNIKRIAKELRDVQLRIEKSIRWPRILRVLLRGTRHSKVPTERLKTLGAELRDMQKEFSDRIKALKSRSKSNQVSPTLLSKRTGSVNSQLSGAPLGSDLLSPIERRHLGVDIILCVHNAAEDTARCIESIFQNTFVDFSLIVVNDGSDQETSALLESATRKYRNINLIVNKKAKGYTVASNQGLARTVRENVLMLNSDTILPPGWVERLIAPACKVPEIGIVGPVSNAATFQSIPEVVSADGKWMVNELPPGWTVDGLDRLVRRSGDGPLIDTSLVNGFCYLIKRSVLEKVGLFDEETFPRGYGEETDFCLRTVAAGFRCAVTPLLYVYHAKSKSFGSETRAEICKTSNNILWDRYGKEEIGKRTDQLNNSPELAVLRDRVKGALGQQEVAETFNRKPSIGFLLPCAPGGGGVHSVVQESTGLLRLGHDVAIFVREKDKERYTTLYKDIIREYPRLFHVYDSNEDLIHATAPYDVIIATIFTSVKLLKMILDAHPQILGAYYIQDYEPLFFDKDSDPALHAEAMDSYTLIEGCVLFAKTYWLVDTVKSKHGVHVHKVVPSIDHSVYFPAPSQERLDGQPIVLCAMVRVSSARRAPGNTMHVLSSLKRSFNDSIEVRIFGTPDSDLGVRPLETSFEFENHGYLTRSEVADLLRESDVFLDLSTYQAFGRTALEAMACSTAVVVPQSGGSGEYAINDQNCLVVDTENLPLVIEKISALLKHRDRIERFREEGIRTAARFRIETASSSISDLFSYCLNSC